MSRSFAISVCPVASRTFFLVAVALSTALPLAGGCDPDLTVAPSASVPADAGEARVSTPQVSTDASNVAEPDASSATDAAGAASETGTAGHVIDGTNDFTAGEKFATTAAGYDAYVSWDAKKIYFGMSGLDIASGAASKWVLLYVDGVPGNTGTPTGISYDCSTNCLPQPANLPFNAGFHLRWKADGQYTNLQKWNGALWSDVGSVATFAQKGTFWEVSLVRSVLGSPSKLKVHMNMLIELRDSEWTYAGLPSTSFTDGKAPAAFTKYYEFDLADTVKAPNTYVPK